MWDGQDVRERRGDEQGRCNMCEEDDNRDYGRSSSQQRRMRNRREWQDGTMQRSQKERSTWCALIDGTLCYNVKIAPFSSRQPFVFSIAIISATYSCHNIAKNASVAGWYTMGCPPLAPAWRARSLCSVLKSDCVKKTEEDFYRKFIRTSSSIFEWLLELINQRPALIN